MANNKDFKVKNGIQPTVYHEGVGSVTSGSYTNAYDLSVAAYDSVEFIVNTQETGVTAVFFKDDGTKMYIIGYNGDEINEYSLSTAWDITTASASYVLSVSSYETLPRGLVFKTDGTSLYFTGLGNDQVRQYDMTTAWDISTASYSKTFSVSSQETSPSGLFFKSDGTKMYVSGQSGVDINEYNLSTAWDVSTASYSQNFSISSEFASNSPQALFFKSDGTKVFVVGRDETHVVSYTLSTAWDISTASYDGTSFSVATQDGQPYGVFFKSDGLKMYIAGDGMNRIFQYSTGSTVTTATLDLSTGSVFEITPTSDIQIGLSNPAASGTVSAATLLLDGAVNGYDLSGAAYDSVSFSLTGQLSNPHGIKINNDGTKLYVVDVSTDTIFQYSMSTANDLSTLSYDSVSLSVSSQESTPRGLAFNNNGTKMYVVGSGSDSIYQYSLTTAFDISTASYDSVSLSLSSQDTNPYDVVFNNDGTKMYIVGNTGDSVYQYSLTTAYDLSTASYDSVVLDFSSQETNPRALAFNEDGTKIFISGNTSDAVLQYSLTTAYDLSTASYDDVSFSISSQGIDPRGIAFSTDGTKMFFAEDSTDTIYQYTTGSAYTVTYDSTLQWGGGTAPDSPAANETDVITFTTRDGGTTYQAAIAIDGAA